MRSKLFFIFLSLIITLSVNGQKRINRETWREVKDGLYYESEESKGSSDKTEDWTKKLNRKRKNGGSLNTKPRETEYLNEKRREISSDSSEEMSLTIPTWLTYLAYFIVAIVLAIVIFKLFFQDNRVRDKKFEVKEEEEDVPIEKPFNELDALLAKSISAGEYRVAVRIYFIYLIKTLREKNWIHWEKKKTNTAYLFEMRERKQYSEFSQVTLYFELIWYGNRDISKEQFDQLRPKFDSLLKSIQSHG